MDKVRWGDIERKLRRFGLETMPAGRGSHWKILGYVDGIRRVFPVPVHGGMVKGVYIRKIRRRFNLLPEFGVSDADWDKA